MKKTKTILALSLSALGLAAASAQAQTNVTIYGRANLSLENTKIEGLSSKQQVVNNSSRLGFRGTEDLGGGLSALFTYEAGVAADGSGASGPFTNRQTFVGLKSDSIGTLRLGRITSPLYYAVPDYISMHNHDTGFSADALFWVPAYGNVFVNNSLVYATPVWGGFQAQAQYSVGLNAQEGPIPGVAPKDRHFTITGDYGNGPLHVGFGYGRTKRNSFTNAVGANIEEGKDSVWAISGLYDFKAVVVGALYERAKSEGSSSGLGLAGSHKRNYWRISAMAPIGAHEIHANYGQAGDWSNSNNNGAKQYTVAYGYNLSKRTKAYVFYTRLDNDSQGKLYSAFGSGAEIGAAPVGFYQRSISLGLRHNF